MTGAGESRPFRANSALLVGLGIATGLALRIWIATTHYGNYDQASWKIVAEIVARGGNVYAETSRYNYGPIWFLLLALLRGIARAADWPFPAVVRGFLTLADAGNAVLVGLLARAAGVRSAGAGALVYALSPVAILIVGFHGQFDNLAALPLLAATLVHVRAGGKERLPAVWALATLALCIKHLCLFSVWMLLVYASGALRKAAFLMTGSVLVFAIQFLPWLAAGRDGILRNVLAYGGIPRPYGLTAVLPRGIVYVVFVVVLASLPLVARSTLRLTVTRAMELAAVALMALIPGTGEAYFIVPAIWGAIHASTGFWIFSGVAYLFLLTGPNNLQAIPTAQPWNAVWAALVAWGALLVVGAVRARREAGPA